MGSKTRLGSYCTKRANNGVNLVTSRKINTRLARPNRTRCIIVPIHKKGNTSDPNNYRGISLVSCFAKLFNTILNKRLKEWAVQTIK